MVMQDSHQSWGSAELCGISHSLDACRLSRGLGVRRRTSMPPSHRCSRDRIFPAGAYFKYKMLADEPNACVTHQRLRSRRRVARIW